MSDLSPNFGRLVQQARLEKGLSQQDLAEKSGVTLYTIRKIEQGKATGLFVNVARMLLILDLELNKVFVERRIKV